MEDECVLLLFCTTQLEVTCWVSVGSYCWPSSPLFPCSLSCLFLMFCSWFLFPRSWCKHVEWLWPHESQTLLDVQAFELWPLLRHPKYNPSSCTNFILSPTGFSIIVRHWCRVWPFFLQKMHVRSVFSLVLVVKVLTPRWLFLWYLDCSLSTRLDLSWSGSLIEWCSWIACNTSLHVEKPHKVPEVREHFMFILINRGLSVPTWAQPIR